MLCDVSKQFMSFIWLIIQKDASQTALAQAHYSQNSETQMYILALS